MELSNIKFSGTSSTYSSTNTSTATFNQGQSSDKAVEVYSTNQQDGETENLKESMNEMNKAMEALNSNIQFTWHEKTGRLIVQVVDIKKGEVLKEFPPHEFLDTMAKIRDYIGMILDIKG